MNCPLCAQPMQMMLDLPRFPITERYEPWEPQFEEGRGLVDQSLWFCDACCHGQLGTIVPDLYGSEYRTRTSFSDGARQAVSRFAYFICRASAELVIDIGGNDGEATKYFKNVVVVDPHSDAGIRATIEDADLSAYAGVPKVIMSSHTIEHLERPDAMIEKCAAIMQKGDLLALQFPSLELLVADARIDQIHHQHLHYFSLRSISLLLERHGLLITRTQFDPQHWGALMLVAEKAEKGLPVLYPASLRAIDVQNAIRSFQNIEVRIPRGALALGAALMLPVAAYWWPELDAVEMIADDDKTKNGLRYINFNKPIGSDYALAGKDVVITAIGTKEAARKLTKKAIDAGARSIILPLGVL